ncbi:MAG: hypothetical protein EON95_08355, partial [Caulobacteraceae bacterium]
MPAASAKAPGRYPATPDGRYFVVRGRLWRCADPALPETRRAELVARLMSARRAVGQALRAADPSALAAARAAVDLAKRALGERGPVWWTDGAPDLNRRLAVNTPYAGWWAAIAAAAEPRSA